MREIRMLRSTWRGLETWHGRDGVTLANERARQRRTQTSTYTGAPVLDPTWERAEVKSLRATRHTQRPPVGPEPESVRRTGRIIACRAVKRRLA